jgi:hypothetical protein
MLQRWFPALLLAVIVVTFLGVYAVIPERHVDNPLAARP